MKNLIYVIALMVIVSLSSCVQEEHQKTIQFQVDMNGVENVNQVGIRGDFTDRRWQQTIPLSDENKDGIYEVSLTDTTAVYGIEFKFVLNGNDYELKDQKNREIVFEYRPEKIVYSAKFNNQEAKVTRD